MSNKKKITIECTIKQALIIERCLEVVSRIGAGQLSHIEEAISLCQDKCLYVKLPNGEKAMGFKLGSWINDTLKPILFPRLHPNASYGIGMKEIPNSQIMYEMYKIFQNKRAKREKHHEHSVTWHEPLKYSKEPLIKIEECIMPHKKASGTNDPETTKKIKEGKLKQIGSQEGSSKFGKFKVKVYEKK